MEVIVFELYILETCPYCRKVIDFMKERNIEHKTFDIANPENLETLMELGGVRQVPFLYDKDNEVAMYESCDIIDYVRLRVR